MRFFRDLEKGGPIETQNSLGDHVPLPPMAILHIIESRAVSFLVLVNAPSEFPAFGMPSDGLYQSLWGWA